MAKGRVKYVCEECGAESATWLGRCPSCGSWDTLREEAVLKSSPSEARSPGVGGVSSPQALSEVSLDAARRSPLGDAELDRVLGGGLVPGSIVLLGGEPGIGKSTLLLQTVLRSHRRVLYVSGEESAQQIRLRADRVAPGGGADCLVVNDTFMDHLARYVDDTRPDLVVVDSIQTMQSERLDALPGSVSQIRECTQQLLPIAKGRGVPVLVVGHINKEGQIAGPKVLEHMVDVVLQFEGDRTHLYRLLRGVKNRFGSTDEVGIYEMRGDGLVGVSNPSELLLGGHTLGLSGVAVAAAVEGNRPFLIETQALVSTAAYGTPQRSATGFDQRRLAMLLAVLERRAGFRLAQKDVFLNLAGGLRVVDTALDLPIAAAIFSSSSDAAIPSEVCLCGEIGLSGELRAVPRLEQRVGEAARLGFKRIIVPQGGGLSSRAAQECQVCQVERLTEAFRELFK